LTNNLAFHSYFARKCGLPAEGSTPLADPSWTPTSWTRHSRITAPVG
jgi:hypothetical protein